tara:strand:- start:1871 stop:2395 length:525 start_codon:yes stop_codon:yes gene_type:complete
MARYNTNVRKMRETRISRQSQPWVDKENPSATGWRRTTVTRGPNDKCCGQTYHVYYSPNGVMIRSLKRVRKHIEANSVPQNNVTHNITLQIVTPTQTSSEQNHTVPGPTELIRQTNSHELLPQPNLSLSSHDQNDETIMITKTPGGGYHKRWYYNEHTNEQFWEEWKKDYDYDE